MKHIRVLAVCLALVLFCGGLTGCTNTMADYKDAQERVDKLQNEIDNMPTLSLEEDDATTTATTSVTTTIRKSTTTTSTTTTKITTTTTRTTVGTMVWVSATGKKYHNNSSCSGMKNPTQISLSDAQRRGLTPCKNCY